MELFYYPLPTGLFSSREFNALNSARSVCEQIREWQGTDTLSQHSDDIRDILTSAFNEDKAQGFADVIRLLPVDITLAELYTYLSASTDEQRTNILEAVYQRLELPLPSEGLLPPRVRMMTMHGVKGLSGHVVFIPSLEEDSLPQWKHRGYAGLILEDARLLYVSITRARAACIFTYATNRFVSGEPRVRSGSRFSTYLGGEFKPKPNGFSINSSDAEAIAQTVMRLRDQE